MATITKIRVALATVGLLLTYSANSSDAVSRVISSTNGTIIMQSGNRAGLQQVFAWNNQCRAVPISFSGRATVGNLLKVGGQFRVLAGRCKGHKVGGFTVAYKAPRSFKGVAKVSYTLKAANNANYYKFTRLMTIR
jgi:hypothetical protein